LLNQNQYVKRKQLHHNPKAHISYHVGLELVRQFLTYASHRTVDELQAFTSQWVPAPHWVHIEDFDIPAEAIVSAVQHLTSHLGPYGIEQVGGATCWQWRREETPLKAEWIEMRKDYIARKRKNEKCTRCMLYVHGGAYFFGSVDEHRYQMQRHARKLKALVLAPRYRLAPQFPFPCGLLDCLAAYLYLLTVQDPSTIVLAGDSAGGGIIVSMLVILRDQRLPLPAGAILISPWVDLTHSFPSVTRSDNFDYVPSHGFLQRPSMSWPPPDSDELEALGQVMVKSANGEELTARKLREQFRSKASSEKLAPHDARHNQEIPCQSQGLSTGNHYRDIGKHDYGVAQAQGNIPHGSENIKSTSQPKQHENGNLSINLSDGGIVEIKDQVQMYTTNTLLSHPLVSPVMQPSLGGLPPLLVLVGGGELLRDEQIYLAHKAAAPSIYPTTISKDGASATAVEAATRWPPTNVQLQVWEDGCHVLPTLSFTRPAKFMYRNVAQFGAWALARAQNTEILIWDDDEVSIISSGEASSSDIAVHEFHDRKWQTKDGNGTAIGKAGDPLPPFQHHMIRQRVTRHGEIFPLAPASELPACTMEPSLIGVIKPGPVRKWLAATKSFNQRYAKEKRKVQKQRVKEMQEGGYCIIGDGEFPPPTALAGRRREHLPKVEKKRVSRGLAVWSGWGSQHDELAVVREEEMENDGGQEIGPLRDTQDIVQGADVVDGRIGRRKSRYRAVSYAGQLREEDYETARTSQPVTATAEPLAMHASPVE